MSLPRIVELPLIYILFLTNILPAQANNIERDSSDPNVSNGICYYAAGQPADSSYIPCGNTAFGNFSCCESLSNCLGHNACWSKDGTTYVAGCTDPSYSDSTCPTKGPYSDQQWAGLVYCNGTSDEWTLCDDSSTGSNQVSFGTPCWCPADESSRNLAFSAPGSIAPHISLPAATGSAMSFFDGYSASTVPTSTTSSTSATTSSSSSTPTSSSSTVTSSLMTPATSTSSSASSSGEPASAVAQSKSGLSTAAKIGIGISAGIAGLAALALIGCIPIYLRRRKRRQTSELDGGAIRPHSEVSANDHGYYEAVPQRSPAWSGNKSELPGDERHSPSAGTRSPESMQQPWSRPISTEVEGGTPTYQSMASGGSRGLSATYQPYRRPEVSPIGTMGVQGSSSTSQASYIPGRQVGDDVYEMPAHLSGSTLP